MMGLLYGLLLVAPPGQPESRCARRLAFRLRLPRYPQAAGMRLGVDNVDLFVLAVFVLVLVACYFQIPQVQALITSHFLQGAYDDGLLAVLAERREIRSFGRERVHQAQP